MSVPVDTAVLKMLYVDVLLQKKRVRNPSGSTLNHVSCLKFRHFYHSYLTRPCMLVYNKPVVTYAKLTYSLHGAESFLRS